jgi:hypothetical protein
MRKKYQPKGIHTANMPSREHTFGAPRPIPAEPFITIAQQEGAECIALPRRLAESLSKRASHAAIWSLWDRELTAKVSADCHVPVEFVESLDKSARSWIDVFLSGIGGQPDELVVFNRLGETVRELARRGHVVLHGHGSTYITHNLPAGLHVRLIAPMSFRIRNLAARSGLSTRDAERQLRRHERQQRAFFARRGLGRPLAPDMFAAALNVAELDEQRLIRAIVAMVPDVTKL